MTRSAVSMPSRSSRCVDLRAVKRLAFADADAIGQQVRSLFADGPVRRRHALLFRVPLGDLAGADGAAADPGRDHGQRRERRRRLGIYEYEADEETILADLLPRNLSVQIFRALLENAASEMGAKMTAMDSATRNAGDMIDRLTLNYNRTRQAQITKELIEIISGAEALCWTSRAETHIEATMR